MKIGGFIMFLSYLTDSNKEGFELGNDSFFNDLKGKVNEKEFNDMKNERNDRFSSLFYGQIDNQEEANH